MYRSAGFYRERERERGVVQVKGGGRGKKNTKTKILNTVHVVYGNVIKNMNHRQIPYLLIISRYKKIIKSSINVSSIINLLVLFLNLVCILICD